ncbi:MAG: MFS transporter [Armatimonadota bacterium]|nr:MFS transporter [Armatimonadota bacterium]
MSRLLGLYVPTLAVSFAQGMIFPAVPALAGHFGVSPGLAAQVVSAQMAGRMLALLPAGALVDRLGPWIVLLLGSIFIVAGGAGLLLAQAFWVVLLGQALAGAGSSLWTAGREIAGLGLVRADQRGRLMSGFFGLQTLGLAAGPVAGGLVVDAAGLRTLFALFAGVGVAVLAITLLLDRSAARPPARTAPLAAILHGWREIAPADRATYAVLVLATFAMNVYRTSLNSLLPVYAGASLGFPAARVGALFGIISLGVLVMIVPSGLVLDRVGRKWGAVPAVAVPAVAFAVLPLARTGPHLALLAAALGLASGLSLGSMSTFSYDVIPEHARGVLQAQRRLLGDLGGLAGPMAGGLLADAYGAEIAFLAYAPLLALAALLLAFGARETLVRR